MEVESLINKYLGSETSKLLSYFIKRDDRIGKIRINNLLVFEYIPSEAERFTGLSFEQQKTAIDKLIEFDTIRKYEDSEKIYFSINYKII